MKNKTAEWLRGASHTPGPMKGIVGTSTGRVSCSYAAGQKRKAEWLSRPVQFEGVACVTLVEPEDPCDVDFMNTISS